MEVNASAKHKHTGQYPQDWLPVTFDDLFAFQNGVNADKSDYGAGTQFINVLEVITHAHICEANIPGRVRLSEARQRSYAVQRGDVVFNRTSETQEEVGLAAVYEGDTPVVFGGFVIRGRPKSTAIDGRYAGYALRAHDVRRQIIAAGQGGIRANIGQGDLRKVVVHIPPVPEQKAIAQALFDVDDLIQSIERMIAKKRSLKQAAMQQLLTAQTRLPGFSGDWVMRPLMSTLRIAQGQVDPRHAPYRSMTLVAPDHIDTGTGRLVIRRTAADQAAISGKYLFSAGDVIYSKIRPYLRKATLATFDGLCSADMYPLRPAEDIAAGYLIYVILGERFSRYAESVSVRSGMPKINRQEMAGFSFAVPPLSEQKAIAEVLSDMDAEITALEARLVKTRDLKQGMMQELLTGRTRLV